MTPRRQINRAFSIAYWIVVCLLQTALLQAAPSQQNLSSAVLSVQYKGAEEKPIPALFIAVVGQRIEPDVIRSLSDEPWDQDRLRDRKPIQITPEEMRDFLTALDRFKKSGADKPAAPYLEVTEVTLTTKPLKAQHILLSRSQALEFFVTGRNALHADPRDITLMNGDANREAMRALQSFGCATDLLPEGIPAQDVTGSVTLHRSGLKLTEKKNLFACTITVTNSSAEPIKGPLSLVLDMTPNSQALDPDGYTCRTSPVGREFFNLPMPEAVLRPKQSLETTIRLTGSSLEPLDFTLRVLAKPAER